MSALTSRGRLALPDAPWGHGGGLGAIAGSGVGSAATHFVQALRNKGIQNVMDLVWEGTKNANVGRAFMARVKGPSDLSPKSNIGKALLGALIAPTVATSAARPQSQ